MIMHDLDLKKSSPTTFNKVIDLSTLPVEVVEFFSKHISNVLTNRKILNCRFIDHESMVLKDCIAIAKKPAEDQIFIDHTVNIAQKLFNSMETSTSTSSGALIFVTFTINEEETRYLGLLKMDPNKAIQLDPDNNTFKVQKDILPSVKENLHKCSVIKLESNLFSEEVHLRVLDKQQLKGEVSKFFLTAFLQAKKVVNDKTMTDLIHKKLLEYALAESIIEVNQLAGFALEVDQILYPGRKVDLDVDLEGLFGSYFEGEADIEEAINSFKMVLRDDYENAYFRFTAESDTPTFYNITEQEKKIKVSFPTQLQETNVFLSEEFEDGVRTRVIKIRGLDLKEKVI
ncbi:nucleoid-associated protein [Paenibacillus frigoriresistens]|nr:nucleoid-associated protein [Paenibacillus frigoriresistens]